MIVDGTVLAPLHTGLLNRRLGEGQKLSEKRMDEGVAIGGAAVARKQQGGCRAVGQVTTKSDEDDNDDKADDDCGVLEEATDWTYTTFRISVSAR